MREGAALDLHDLRHIDHGLAGQKHLVGFAVAAHFDLPAAAGDVVPDFDVIDGLGLRHKA
jgi:hypothetical protein